MDLDPGTAAPGAPPSGEKRNDKRTRPAQRNSHRGRTDEVTGVVDGFLDLLSLGFDIVTGYHRDSLGRLARYMTKRATRTATAAPMK